VALGQEPPSDSALVAAIGDQDHDALSEIYRRHGGAVWSVAKRVCRSAELAEDVCQTVFTELWSRPERFDPSRSGLRPWLVAQAHSRAVDAARAEKARRHHERGGGEIDPTPPSAEVEVAAHVGSLAKGARRAFDRLPTVERDAILLAYLGGHTSMETARLLGAPEATVKSRVRQGLMNLRRTVQTEGVSR
jgi:RNA polymerase sigma-70 factor (ECF subfamily)